jgi:predicted dinucleotide-binding enzyme
MKIVVIGGSGLIGSKLVTKLRERGHEAVPASPASGVNTLTGEGLTEALEGAAVVVDVSNSPSFEDAAALTFFQTSTETSSTLTRPQAWAITSRCRSWAPNASRKAATCAPRSRKRT